MFDQNSAFDAKSVCCNPVCRSPKATEAPMGDHPFPVWDDQPRLIFERFRQIAYQIEQSLSSRLDVSTVLYVLRRPVSFGRR
jgi:hypothetical protein